MAISLVQQHPGSFGTSPFTSAAFTGATTTGNTIIVATTGSNGSNPGVTDNYGNTYTLVVRQISWTGAQIYLYYSPNITGGAGHTISIGGSGQPVAVLADEVSGLASFQSADKSNTGNNSSGTSLSTSATATTSFANEYVFAAFAQASTGENFTLGSGYANLKQVNSQSPSLAAESKIVSSTGAQSATMTSDVSASWDGVIATFADTPIIALSTVTTQASSSIGKTSATANGNITVTGGENNDHRGVVYDTVSRALPGNVAPASSGYSNSIDEAGTFGTGAFTRSMTGLSKNTTYYVRAYSHNSAGYSYGNEITFDVLASVPLVDKFSDTDMQFVDNTTSTGADRILLEDGTSLLLLEDNTSKVLLNTPYASSDYVTYTQQTALTGGTTYYWRVRAKQTGEIYGPWSEVRSFTVSGGSFSRTHTTDTSKRKAGLTLVHTTDVLKRASSLKTHTTDVLKRAAVTKTHTTDLLKRKATLKTHTTDVNKKKSGVLASHLTDVNKRKLTTRTHTTDVLKRAAVTKSHTTDVLKRKQSTLTHTTDVNKRKATTISHTTDVYKSPTVLTTTLTVDGDGYARTGWNAEGYDWTRLTSDDGDTNKIYSPTLNDVAWFTVTDPSGLAGATITGVTVYFKAESISTYNSTFQIGVRTNSTDYFGSNKTTTDATYNLYSESWSTNPNTGVAWTVSDLNALQIGIKKTDANGTRVTYAYVVVQYTPGSGATYTRSHTTDIFRRAAVTRTHTTDINKLKSGATLTHTTDVLKRKTVTKSHTTDVNKRKATTLVHTTDINKRKATLRTHTTDTYVRNRPISELVDDFNDNSVNTGLWSATNVSESSQKLNIIGAVSGAMNSVKRYNMLGSSSLVQFPAWSATGSAYILYLGNAAVSQFVCWYIATGTIRAYMYNGAFNTQGTTPAYVAATHQWFRIRESGGTVYWDYSADGISWTNHASLATSSVPFDTNNVMQSFSENNQTSGTTSWDNFNVPPTPSFTRTHTTDVLKRLAATKTHTTDVNKLKSGVTKTHSTDVNKKLSAITRSHTTDVNKRKVVAKTHTTDINKRAAGLLRVHTTDVNKQKTGVTKSHTTDVLKRSTNTRTHTTDVLKRANLLRVHSTDINKRKATTRSHSTDVNKLKTGNARTHSTDVNKRLAGIIRTHTTDVLKRGSYTRVHTTDTLKRKITTKTHTTDVLKKNLFTKTHTTDTYVTYNDYSREDKAALPADASTLATRYTGTDRTYVATDDNTNYVDLAGSSFLVHEFKHKHTDSVSTITPICNIKTTLAPTVSTVYLQIYNYNSASWETLDTDNTTAANTDFTLTGSITSSISNYYTTGNWVSCRIYQEVI